MVFLPIISKKWTVKFWVRTWIISGYGKKNHEDEFEEALKRFAELRRHATKKQREAAKKALVSIWDTTFTRVVTAHDVCANVPAH